ncbi:hypothetical protein [Bradyrhizobium sp.]|uniref:hypothetical protein n=1 Tax=Bradyrhizobium sp. TaxID=376 RepID=UPI003C56F076
MSITDTATVPTPIARYEVTDEGMIAALWFAGRDTLYIATLLGQHESFVANRLANIRDRDAAVVGMVAS